MNPHLEEEETDLEVRCPASNFTASQWQGKSLFHSISVRRSPTMCQVPWDMWRWSDQCAQGDLILSSRFPKWHISLSIYEYSQKEK